jgi:hypothetical protein
MILSRNDIGEDKRGPVPRLDAPARSLITELWLGGCHEHSRRRYGSACVECKESDVMVVAKGDICQGEGSSILRLDAPAKRFVDRVWTGSLDAQHTNLDGRAGDSLQATIQDPSNHGVAYLVLRRDSRTGTRSYDALMVPGDCEVCHQRRRASG